MILYKITNWTELYENNRTRELKVLNWVPIPNSHDGDGYTFIMSQDDAESLFGAWVVILQVASKCHPRGVLIRGSHPSAGFPQATATPHTAASISRMTRFSENTISKCLKLLSRPEVGWITCENTNDSTIPAGECENPAPSCDNPAGECASRARAQGMEGNGKKEEKEPSVEFRILDHLNQKTGRSFRAIDANLKLISVRLSEVEGDEAGILQMIDRQCALWKGKDQEEYLRPETLFGKTKFNGYYDSRSVAVKPGFKAAPIGRNGVELLTHFSDGTPCPIITEEGSGHPTRPMDDFPI